MFSLLCWAVTMLAAVVAGFMTINGLSGAQSAPQQAAAAAMGLAIVVIPYVFARAVQEWSEASVRRAAWERLADTPEPAEPHAT